MFASIRKTYYLPVLLLIVLVFALAIAAPVSADDGQPVDPPVVEEVTAPPPVDEEAPAPIEEAPAPLPTRDTSLGVVEGDPYFDVGGTRYSFTHADCDPDTLGDQNCSTPIQAALDYMSDHGITPTDRKLNIESVDDTGSDYDEDVDVYGFLPGVKGLLSIAGDGLEPEDVVIDGSVNVYEMPAGFTIRNLTVTNSDLEGAAIYFGGNSGLVQLVDVNATASGQDGIGIVVTQHHGNVELNRVKANDSGYHGAIIDVWSQTGTVKVTNSEFNGNLQNVDDGWADFDTWYDEFDVEHQDANYSGLYLWPWNGAVTLNGVQANNNLGTGVDISAGGSTITVKNSAFENNDWSGLSIGGNAIILDHILSANNGGSGIFGYINSSLTGTNLYLENNGEDGLWVMGCQDWGDADPYCDNPGPGTVTIKMSSATGNGVNGFSVYTKGAITIADAYVADNGLAGYYLDNEESPSPAPITVTNASSYSNDSDGYEIYSRGAVTMTNFFGSDNGGHGLRIENSGPGAVTLTNSGSLFNETANNGMHGYYIESLGAITIINTDTYNNFGLGAYIDNAGAATAAPITMKVSIPGYYFNGFINNGAGGVEIHSRGVVSISGMAVRYNRGPGAIINNIPTGTLAGVAVTISDSEFYGNNDEDDLTSEHGLDVRSKGAITLLNVNSFDNAGKGAYLDNTAGTAGVTINAGTNKGNVFLNNIESGVVILTKGAVTLTNVNATQNGRYGLIIDNLGGTGGVTIKETGNWGAGFDYNNPWSWGNSYSRNGQDGLNILTKGVVNVVFNHASENGWNGIYIDASGGSGTVTVAGNTNHVGDVYNNGGAPNDNGLTIIAKGNITLAKVNAVGNYDFGANLYNFDGTGGVTLTDAYFDENFRGLLINTKGAVVWKNGSASNNTDYGARILNSGSLAPYKSVTLTNIWTGVNGGTGLFIDSKGAVLLTNVESSNNSANNYFIQYGEKWIDNMSPEQTWFFDGLTGEDVTIKVNSLKFNPSIYVFDSNWELIDSIDGVDGSAVLTLSDLEYDDTYRIQVMTDMGWDGLSYDISIYEGMVEPTYDENADSANGIYIDNHNGVNAPVTITNTTHTWEGNNSGVDIAIFSSGAVSLTKMDINDSLEGGLLINNTFPTATPGVTLTDVNFFNNDGTGGLIITDGVVTIKNSVVGGNGIRGGYGLFIDNDGGTGAVTLTNVDVNSSGLTGLYITSKGAVTMTDIWANNNGSDGVSITTNGAVTFKNIDANDNNGFGAFVTTPSTFTVIQPAIGWNHFGGNALDGLYVEASGKITLTNVRASNNGWWDEDTILTDADGIHLENDGNGLGTAPIVLTNIETNGNTLDGLDITTKSAVTITTATANWNVDNGVVLSQLAGPVVAPVITLTTITADGNGLDGLHVDGYGNIIANKLNTSSNGNHGTYLNNEAGTGSVTILNTKGANFIGFNGYFGMFIASRGVVTVTGVEALGNTYDGVRIRNSNAIVPTAVTVNSLLLRNNGLRDEFGTVTMADGLMIDSDGIVTVNNSWSLGNTHNGFVVATSNNVFFNNSSAVSNDRAGIRVIMVDTSKTLKLTGSTWLGNLRNPSLPTDRNLMANVTPVIL